MVEGFDTLWDFLKYEIAGENPYKDLGKERPGLVAYFFEPFSVNPHASGAGGEPAPKGGGFSRFQDVMSGSRKAN